MYSLLFVYACTRSPQLLPILKPPFPTRPTTDPFDLEEQVHENGLYATVEILRELVGLFAFAFLVFKFLLPFIVFFYLLRMARVVRIELKVRYYLDKVITLAEIQRLYQNLAFSVRLPQTLKDIKNELSTMSIAHYQA